MKGYGFFFVCPTLTRNRNAAAAKSSFPAQTVAKRLGFTSNIFAMKGQVSQATEASKQCSKAFPKEQLCYDLSLFAATPM